MNLVTDNGWHDSFGQMLLLTASTSSLSGLVKVSTLQAVHNQTAGGHGLDAFYTSVTGLQLISSTARAVGQRWSVWNPRSKALLEPQREKQPS